MRDIINATIGENHFLKCSTYSIARNGEGLTPRLAISIPNGLYDYWAYIDFKKPNGETFKTPRIDVSEGKITYDVPCAVLDADGVLEVQVVFQKENGEIWKTYVKEFAVRYSINATDDITNKKDFVEEVQKSMDSATGKKTADGGEIFNNYEENKAVTSNTHAEGDNTVAGCKGFYITDIKIYKDNTETTITGSVPAGTTLRVYFKSTDLQYDGQSGESVTNQFKNIIEKLKELYNISLGIYSQIDNGDKYRKWYHLGGKVLFANPVIKGIKVDRDTYKETVYIDIRTEVEIPYKYLRPEYLDTGEINEVTTSMLWVSKGVEFGCQELFTAGHSEGALTKAVGTASHSEGYDNIADGKFSHTEGTGNFAGYSCHAEGKNNVANGEQAHVEGVNNKAIGYNVHVEGDNNKGTGTSSHAEGSWNTVTSKDGHVEGFENVVEGIASHGEGYGTRAIGNYSHAEGTGTKAIGENSHAQGLRAIATGKASHAEGVNTDPAYYTENAYGEASHTQGTNCRAYSKNGHAGGSGSVVGTKDTSNAENGFAQGEGLSVTRYKNQVAFGKNNLEEDNAIFMVGNGYWGNLENGATGPIRKNAFVIKSKNPNCDSWSPTRAWAEVESQGTTDTSVIIKATFDKLLNALENITSTEDIKTVVKQIRKEIGG